MAKSKMICPKRGNEMNHHADKLIYSSEGREAANFDASLAVWSRKPTAAPAAVPSPHESPRSKRSWQLNFPRRASNFLVLQSLLVQPFELSRCRPQQHLLNYRRKLPSREVIFSPKSRQRLVRLARFEILPFGNRFATNPILRVYPMQFPPMVPPTFDTVISPLAPMALVMNTTLIGIQPPLVSVGNAVLQAVDFGHWREAFPPFPTPDVITRSMDKSVCPDNLSAPTILLGKAVNLSFKVRFH